MVIAYHVTTKKKLDKYVSSGFIKAPARVWINIEEAERFSKQTGRKIILRLKIKKMDFEKLEGHKNMALISYKNLEVNSL